MKNLSKITLILVLFFNLIQSADSHQQNNLGKRFIAGFGQGAVYAPLTPAILITALVFSPVIAEATYDELDKWAKNKDVRPKVSKSTGDKVQLAGQVAGYLSTGFVIVKRSPILRILFSK